MIYFLALFIIYNQELDSKLALIHYLNLYFTL